MLRTIAALVLACAGPGVFAQTGKFGLDQLRDALKVPFPDRPSAAAPAQGQAPAPAAPAAAAAPSPEPATSPAAAPVAASPAALPDIEQWTTQLPPVSTHTPYAVLAGARFEAFSNPCAGGKGRCWVPIAHLPMAGHLPIGQEIHLAYKAGGKPWFVERFRSSDAMALLRNRDSAVRLYRFRSGRNQEHLARHTGRIEFEVTHVDPLRSTSRKLAAGHFVVGKQSTGIGGAEDVDYFVSYDWATEVMTVDFMGSGRPSLDYPGITISAVFLQPVERSESMSLHLFHGDKEIASTASWGNAWSASARNHNTRQGYGAFGTAWSLPKVVAYDRQVPRNSSLFVLADNPGKYTIKILRNGELAREASFTITAEGSIDRSLNIAAGSPHGYTVVPARVLGMQDRARASFRSDGLWGNASAMK